MSMCRGSRSPFSPSSVKITGLGKTSDLANYVCTGQPCMAHAQEYSASVLLGHSLHGGVASTRAHGPVEILAASAAPYGSFHVHFENSSSWAVCAYQTASDSLGSNNYIMTIQTALTLPNYSNHSTGGLICRARLLVLATLTRP